MRLLKRSLILGIALSVPAAQAWKWEYHNPDGKKITKTGKDVQDCTGMKMERGAQYEWDPETEQQKFCINVFADDNCEERNGYSCAVWGPRELEQDEVGSFLVNRDPSDWEKTRTSESSQTETSTGTDTATATKTGTATTTSSEETKTSEPTSTDMPPSSTPSSSAPPSSSPPPKLSAGEKAAIGVCVSLGTIGIGAALVLFFLRRRRQQSEVEEKNQPEQPPSGTQFAGQPELEGSSVVGPYGGKSQSGPPNNNNTPVYELE